jgi:hypothetical protein
MASVPERAPRSETRRIDGAGSQHVETDSVVRTMSIRFWHLDSPRNQKLATVDGDTKFEQITCLSNEGHVRGGRRLGDLSASIDPAGIKDFTWTWSNDMLASERLLEVFLKHRVTGFEIRPANISYSKRSQTKPPALYELIVTGWGGMASSAAGLTLVKSCPACNHRNYAIADPSRLIDPASWDGSDLFMYGHCLDFHLPATASRTSFGRNEPPE